MIVLLMLLTAPVYTAPVYTARTYQPSPAEQKVINFSLETRSPDSLVAAIENALAADSENIMLHRRFQDARMAGEKDRSALIADYEKKVERHPRATGFLYLLGRIQTDRTKEKEYYDRAYAADSNNYWSNYGMGAFLLLKGQNPPGAKKFLDRAIAIDNSIYLPFYLYATSGDPAHRAGFLSLALDCEPLNITLIKELTAAAIQAGDYPLVRDRVHRTLTRPTGVPPGIAAAGYEALLDVELDRKDYGRARGYIDSVRAFNPHADLDGAYAEVYARLNRPDSLLFYVKRLVNRFHASNLYPWLRERIDEGLAVMKDKKIVDYLGHIRTAMGLDQPAKLVAGATADGKSISLQRMKGKTVLIDFWASWCAPCRGETPYLVAVYGKYHARGLEIIGVNIDSDRKAMDGYRDANPDMVWPQIFSGKAWKDDNVLRYGVDAIPQILLVDRKGIVRETNLRGEGIEAAVKRIIK